MAKRNAQTFALSHGVERYARMLSETPPGGISEPTSGHSLCQIGALGLEKIPIVGFNKTHLHRLCKPGRFVKSSLCQIASHVGFEHTAQREHTAPQRGLRHSPEKIALVFAHIVAHQQVDVVATSFCFDIMPRGHLSTSQAVGLLLHQAKLEVAIAHNARVGRPSGRIFFDEILYNARFERFSHVDHMVLDAQPIGQGFGSTDEVGLGGTVLKLTRKIPYAHRHAHHLIALLLEHQAHGRTVCAARHGHKYASVHVLFRLFF